MVWEKNWDWELASCFLTISARSLWLKWLFQSPTNCSTVKFIYFYRDLRSNFYRRMLEFNYCSKAKSKNTETVVNCDETSGSAEALKVSELINYSQRTYMSICSKDITIFNFIASFIWVEKLHISIEKQSTFVGLESVLNFWKLWKVKSLDSTRSFRLTSYLIF